MSKLMENVKIANSFVRTLIFLVFSVVVGYGGFLGYDNYIRPSINAKEALAEFEELKFNYQQQQQAFERVSEENSKLKTSLQLLKVDRRRANIEIMNVGVNDQNEPTMNVRFTEFDDDGNVVGASKDFELRGDAMYIDCWVVLFGDKYIEQADALRKASLCAFKGIFGNLDGPQGAVSLDSDSVEEFPEIYATDEKSEFERRIWTDFWKLANSRATQKELGIRSSYGQAIYVKVEPGMTYEIEVRSSGSASIIPKDRLLR